MPEQLTCEVGSKPCSNPATKRLLGDSGPWACEGHRRIIELGQDEDDLQLSLDHLQRWIRAADRYGIRRLQKALRTVRDETASELAELEAEERKIEERYSLPPRTLEQLEGKERDKAELAVHGDDGKRDQAEAGDLWQEHDQRASQFTAAAVALEEEIDRLHTRLEEEVLPLLEEEAAKSEEEANRVRAERGL